MNASTHQKATIALLLWLAVTLGAGYFLRQPIERIFGPDSWWMVMGWLGAVAGLIHFLLILVLARQPRGGEKA